MAALVRPSAQSMRLFAVNTQPSFINAARSAFHTTARPSTLLQRTQAFHPQQSITQHVTPRMLPSTMVSTHRHASTIPSAQQQTPQLPEDYLTWDRFFALRRRRRYVNLASSVVTAVGSCAVFGPMLAQQDIDGWAAQLSGLDPIMVLGICTVAIGAGGWLCGPTFGNSMFKIWAGRRGWNGPIAEKEKSFFARIHRFRADPSSSSPQNPIPDYYGEKIASVKDYRRWLKDQRAFNLKKNKNML